MWPTTSYLKLRMLLIWLRFHPWKSARWDTKCLLVCSFYRVFNVTPQSILYMQAWPAPIFVTGEPLLVSCKGNRKSSRQANSLGGNFKGTGIEDVLSVYQH